MLATIQSAALVGLEAVPVTIEVSLTAGLPAFHVVGLPDAAVRESRERVVSALRESGFAFPMRRITVNLAPAALRKEGASFDLPIALAVLAASGQVPATRAASWLVVGELALDGVLRRVRGALAAAELASRIGCREIVVPAACAREAALARAVDVFPAASLTEAVGWLRGVATPIAFDAGVVANEAGVAHEVTLDDIAGQERAKRALELCAAGGHHVLFAGPPGAGKTMLARALPSLLPPVTHGEALELTRIRSVAGLFDDGELVGVRPFRAPHASASPAAILGGGSSPRPGELTLAHRGVLFLDELPLFRRDVLDALRQPLETGSITVGRAHAAVRFPAEVRLACAMNLCPCGRRGQPRASCRCSPEELRRYRMRVPSPFLDRMDVHLTVGAVRSRELASWRIPRLPGVPNEHESAVGRIARARNVQGGRGAGASSNARLTAAALEEFAPLEPYERRRLLDAVELLGLSARGFHRVWRLARTIADLDGNPRVRADHVDEALSFRSVVNRSDRELSTA